MMAFRAKILHVIVFGLIGATVIIYSSYFTGPVLLYHIDPERSRNITNATSSHHVVASSKSSLEIGKSPSSSPVVLIGHQNAAAVKVPQENQTLDKTAQGILTENLYQSGYNIPNVDLCPELGNKLKLVVGIMSAPSHTEARMAIRQTWGHFGQRRDVSLAFMLGMSRVNTINTATFQESQIYGDVVRADFLDSYDNLTLKTVSLLDWVENYCSKAKFVLKTDDDMFINFPHLLTFIEKHTNAKRTIFGRLARKWKPIRNRKSKYFVSTKQFSLPVFPDFTTGPAYLLTSDIISDMFKRALKSTYLKLEDVFTTGIVAQSIDVKRVHINEFINKRIPFNICNIKKSISIHMVKFHEQFDLWKKLLDGRSKCK
ncbi:beta-1,3-galactosyltransferase 5-like [Rhodnius prolixus]|uniref:beta-1,3-galactosyltransferase 5-like n=1 Tax=Rhodnius prolixus TaxID=13249 RepID=UPI003D18A999